MLGGSFWIAFLRNLLGAGVMMAVFLLLDHPRFTMKRTVYCYVMFGLLISVVFSIWYLLDRNNYIRFAGIASILVVGSFCVLMSSGTKYLSLYKLALGFYLLAFTVFCGIDASRLWFGGNLWADILLRIVIIIGILFFIIKRVRRSFLDWSEELREELDWFSAVALVASGMAAALVIYWPDVHPLSVFHLVRTAFLLFMAGVIQYLVFNYYLYRGREHRYQKEKELMEMSEQFLRRQIELVRESEKEAVRVRHDVRHHCRLIEEYIKNGETDKLVSYVRQYGEDVEKQRIHRICVNEPINSLLSSYAEYAAEENIKVTMKVKVEEDISVRDIDLVAILANVFENAIHGCMCSKSHNPEIRVSVIQKGNKIALQCKNTCREDIELSEGFPKSASGGGVGTFSIVKVVSYYNGEADFAVKNGMFITRVLLNLPMLQTD